MLLTQSEYQESFERSVEKTFDDLYEELSDFFQGALVEYKK